LEPFLFFFIRKISDSMYALSLGLGAGIMLAASSFSLLLPALSLSTKAFGGLPGIILVGVSFFGGSLFIQMIDRFAPHEHFIKGKEGSSKTLKRIWLFVIAITIHNFPEGMAVGVGLGDTALTAGIALQNIPEGMIVALSLVGEDYSKTKAFVIASITGLIEPVGGIFGAIFASLGQSILPAALTFAAGSMIYVIGHEVIPESHRKGVEKFATNGLLAGFLIMSFMALI